MSQVRDRLSWLFEKIEWLFIFKIFIKVISTNVDFPPNRFFSIQRFILFLRIILENPFDEINQNASNARP